MAENVGKKHVYRATLPDGQVVTRTTHRVYTHVAAVLWRDGEGGERWGFIGWCGREDLAQKQLRTWQGSPYYVEGHVIPVDNPR